MPSFALGVGLTNACNLACAHCYRGTGEDFLDRSQVLEAVTSVPTRSVNFGTGENGLHPEFAAIINDLSERGIAVTMTTNGHSAAVLNDIVLAKFRDIEFSIDYPSEERHDVARGQGNWRLITEQMERCKALGVSTTITSVMMKSNVRSMPGLLDLAGARGSYLRVNVYQSVRTDLESLTFEEFWLGFDLLLRYGDLITCGEPVVRAMLDLPRSPGSGCGVETIRVTPKGHVIPCVYGGTAPLSLAQLKARGPAVVDAPEFRSLDIPAACSACAQREHCRGGCGARRALRGESTAPDIYCPIVRNRSVPIGPARMALARELTKASSACTTIFQPRERDAKVVR
jgi:radical SAM protein with 4Fe4S-binding SPASM domain